MASDSFWVWKVRPLFLEPIGDSICGLTEVCRKMTRGPGSLRVILKKKWNPFCTFCLFQVSLGRIIRTCAVNCFAVADPCLSCWQDGNSRNIQLEASQTNHTSSDIYTLLLVSYCGFAQTPKGHLLQFTAEEVASAVGSSLIQSVTNYGYQSLPAFLWHQLAILIQNYQGKKEFEHL